MLLFVHTTYFGYGASKNQAGTDQQAFYWLTTFDNIRIYTGCCRLWEKSFQYPYPVVNAINGSDKIVA